MPTRDVVFFDIGETLGAVIVESSGRLLRLDVFSHVVPVLERLRADGALLGLISNTGTETGEYVDQTLERSGILHYFAPDLRIYSSVVGLKKDTPAIFELAMGRAQRILGRAISNAVFVGESRAERALAVKAGMRSAPHPALARGVLAGGRPAYLLLRVRRDEVQRLGDLFDAAGVVPLRRTDVEGNAEIIALTTDVAIPQLQAGGVAVEVLPGPADAAGDDLYLLRGVPKGPAPAAFAGLAEDGLRPVLSTRDGMVVALAPHQTIDDFHVGDGHGHNLKLLADPTLLFRRVAPPAFTADAMLSPEELASLAATITEQRFEQVLRFVAGMDGRPGAVGINRHVLSPQMRAVTDGLIAEFERIGRGAFNITGHRFEITGRDIRDVAGTPAANRIELYNVIAELPGEGDEVVLVTAHLDSTAAGTFGGSYDPAVHDAPGVDDDGSGVAAVLLIAEFMRIMFAGHKPARTLRFALFNAEEQGLIGSERYARAQASAGARIVAVFQMDMIAYNNSQPNAFEIHAGTADPEAERASLAVADLIRRMAEKLATEGLSILAPAQVLGSPDPADGHSDHSSFQSRGYAGCAASEDFFPSPGNPEDRNPNYHKVSDRVFDLPFATSIARVICAAALRAAHPAVPTAFAAGAGFATPAGIAERVSGRVVVAGGQPLPAGATVSLRAGGPQAPRSVAQAGLGQDGTFAVEIPPGSYHLLVQAADGASLASTHETPLAVEAGRPVQLLLTAEPPPPVTAAEPASRRSALFADMTLNAAAASEVTPDDVLDLARAMIAPGSAPFAARFRTASGAAARSPGFDDDPMRTLCGTERLRTIQKLADLQGYVDPAIVKLKVRDILSMGESGFASRTHVTPNFVINYQTEGPAVVENDLSDFNVMEPGSNPPRVMTTLPGGTVPAYVRLVAFWLERSLQSYTSAPFSMRNPAANGRLSAVINSAPFGGANTDAFYINNALPAELVCAVAVHELFHMVQFSYEGQGDWLHGMMEGGATFAEDTVADLMNRYLDEAGSNFNGIGLLANPNQSLFAPQARYKSSLFWRYLAEQRSRLVDEPTIGVDTYRRVIEECSANGYTTDSVKRAIRALPFDSELCTFCYDAGMADTPASTETTFGNFALACYLKDLAVRPDARFGFLENKENIHIDDVVRLVIADAPSTETLVKVTRERGRVTRGGPKVAFQSSVAPLATRYFELEVDSDVATVDLDFSSTAFSGLLQLVTIEENGDVRDIIRTDKRAYRRRLANQLGARRMSTLAVMVSGGDSGGSFQLSLQSAEALADVMITRWNSETGKEYHHDPHGSSWTWVSPDLWFEPAAGGDFVVKVRLHNKGGKRAESVGCVVEYRPGAAAAPAAPWLPILDASGAVQHIEDERIESGQTREFTLPWKPAHLSQDGIFTLRAIVASPDDANTDNNSAFSRLGVMPASPGGFATFTIPPAMAGLVRAGHIEAVRHPRESSRILLGVGSASGAGNAMLQSSAAAAVRTVTRVRARDDSTRHALPPFCAACSALTLRLRTADGSLAPGATMFFVEQEHEPTATYMAAGAPAGKMTGIGAIFTDDVSLRKPEAGLYASEFWAISRHEAIAAAAERDLSENAADEVRRITAPLGAGLPFAKLAGWADTVKRRRPRPSDDPATVEFLEDERNRDNDTWHYVNIPAQAEGYDRQKYPEFTRGDDVVQMIAQAVRVLTGNSNRFSELNALRLLIHLVGDVHQPIHVGCAYLDRSSEPAKLVYDPQKAASQDLGHDRGGGRLYLPIGSGVNLHTYWDGRLGSLGSGADDDHNHDNDIAAPELKARFVQKLVDMTAALPPPQAQFAPSDPQHWAQQWATESLIAAREAYNSLRIAGMRDSNDFNVSWEGKATYDARCKPVANRQLATAVRNLAALLNRIWS